MTALIESNPRQATESGTQALLQAAAYPEAIAAAAAAAQPASARESPPRAIFGDKISPQRPTKPGKTDTALNMDCP